MLEYLLLIELLYNWFVELPSYFKEPVIISITLLFVFAELEDMIERVLEN